VPATPEDAALLALSWFDNWRAFVPAECASDPPSKTLYPVAGSRVMKRQNARNWSTRRSAGLPAMIAPIEMTAVQSGCRSASANAS
jgi:hypothetical protein